VPEPGVAERLLRPERPSGPLAEDPQTVARLAEGVRDCRERVLDGCVGPSLELDVGALAAGRSRHQPEPERAAILDDHLSLHVSLGHTTLDGGRNPHDSRSELVNDLVV
jgi:hypothetical protein